MVTATSTDMHTNGHQTDYSREEALKVFDSTKSGVKGLVDAGLESIPEIFIQPADELPSQDSTTETLKNLQLPVIDLTGVETSDRREEIVEQIREASQKWGFFQVINHGIPLEVLENAHGKAKMFHEQDDETKKEYYSRDSMKPVKYNTNHDLYSSKAANWRDTLTINNAVTGQLDPNLLPPICREAILDHTNHVLKLGDVLLELLSLALGLRSDRLKELECEKGWAAVYHYHPACPQPELTLGRSRHTDSSFLTVLLQDQIGGLQVLQDDHWIDVKPIHGALVINIGDVLQMITNDKFISACHRVKANRVGPRLSSAIFFSGLFKSAKIYEPLEELISEDNPPIYRGFTVSEFLTKFFSLPVYASKCEPFTIKNCNSGDVIATK